ncbi:DUF2946 family protein [Pandoraea sp.]|uniref:DUF2946 family protein n=1 Tax=Pandoraea sp. TaxID=1883445 RepID=UPI0012121277|nr:DUF2946 family protein [Pandoraea sp.]TAL55613.1 MAG: DUF2946 family protein [Pandoraea sp.]TAM16782.1 MAG: DUF2946 family protein [Pandoraea sp.]
MDEIVKQALAKWPNVPHCFGWLALDRRGVWRMRDEAAQRAGHLGEPIRHTALNGFINRNYGRDDSGQWYFQNGPQRVYVELAYTPFVLRLDWRDETPTLTDQTGEPFEPVACLLDDEGNVLFESAATAGASAHIGVLHDHDLGLLAEHDALPDELPAPPHEARLRWGAIRTLPLRAVARASLPARYGYEPHPAAKPPQTIDTPE